MNRNDLYYYFLFFNYSSNVIFFFFFLDEINDWLIISRSLIRLLEELRKSIKWLNIKFTVDSSGFFPKKISLLFQILFSYFILFREIIIFSIYCYSQIRRKVEIVTIIDECFNLITILQFLHFAFDEERKTSHGGIRIVEFSIDKSWALSVSSVFTYPSGREACPSLWAVLFSISTRKLA